MVTARADPHDIRQREIGLFLLDRPRFRLGSTGMLFNHIHLGNENPTLFRQNLNDVPPFSLVLTGEENHLIFFSDVDHRA
jgi:hypothetical protein